MCLVYLFNECGVHNTSDCYVRICRLWKTSVQSVVYVHQLMRMSVSTVVYVYSDYGCISTNIDICCYIMWCAMLHKWCACMHTVVYKILFVYYGGCFY